MSKYCNKCGKENKDNYIICINCGEPISLIASNNNQNNEIKLENKINELVNDSDVSLNNYRKNMYLLIAAVVITLISIIYNFNNSILNKSSVNEASTSSDENNSNKANEENLNSKVNPNEAAKATLNDNIISLIPFAEENKKYIAVIHKSNDDLHSLVSLLVENGTNYKEVWKNEISNIDDITKRYFEVKDIEGNGKHEICYLSLSMGSHYWNADCDAYAVSDNQNYKVTVDIDNQLTKSDNLKSNPKISEYLTSCATDVKAEIDKINKGNNYSNNEVNSQQNSSVQQSNTIQLNSSNNEANINSDGKLLSIIYTRTNKEVYDYNNKYLNNKYLSNFTAFENMDSGTLTLNFNIKEDINIDEHKNGDLGLNTGAPYKYIPQKEGGPLILSVPKLQLLVRLFDKNGVELTHFLSDNFYNIYKYRDDSKWTLNHIKSDTSFTFNINTMYLKEVKSVEMGFYIQ